MAEATDQVSSGDVYADAHARLAQWRKDLAMSATFEAQQGLRELSHEREHLKDLRADVGGLQGLVEAASQLQAGGARLAEVVHCSNESAGSRALAIGRVCDDLHELHQTRKHEVQQVECNNAQKQQLADAQHAEALTLLGTYRDRLGLAISRVAPQTVRMAFSFLDECDAGRQFSFTLGLGELGGVTREFSSAKTSDGYCVIECVPHVPELPQLLAELNAHAASVTALPRFVCSMRRGFLKVAQEARKA